MMKWAYDQENVQTISTLANTGHVWTSTDQTGRIVGYAVAITLLTVGFAVGLTVGWWLL